MATQVLMPRQGQSVESCIILKWKKHEGDVVEKGDIVCEVETDKATFEVEAPESGIVLKTLFREGDDVTVLTPIAVIGTRGEEIPKPYAGSSGSAPTAGARNGAAPAADSGADDASVTAAPTNTRTTLPPTTAQAARIGATEHPTSNPTNRGRIFASPRAKHLANEQRVPIETLSGTGPGGRIIERDIRSELYGRADRVATGAIERAETSTRGEQSPVRAQSGAGVRTEPGESAVPEAEFFDKPVRGIRKVIAERMQTSLRDSAQLTISSSADARAILAYRKRLKGTAESTGLGIITINDLVHYAVVRVLRRHREMNAHYQDGTIREYRSVHLAFAVDTPRGLIVPVIRSADQLSLYEIARRARDLAGACQSGAVQADDLAGGTFTVSNLGGLGVESFTPVLNTPQIAILGVCAILPRPVMNGSEVEFVPSIGLSLTIDHRAVDGAPAARFLQELCAAIADIEVELAR